MPSSCTCDAFSFSEEGEWYDDATGIMHSTAKPCYHGSGPAVVPEAWQEETFPATLGECIDLAYTLREERLEKEQEVKMMKKREENLRNHLFATFEETTLEGAKGSIATASVGEELKPVVNDWEAVYAFIVENNAFELLEKRVARLAYKERFDAGVQIPGTEAFLHKKLSLVKSHRKG